MIALPSRGNRDLEGDYLVDRLLRHGREPVISLVVVTLFFIALVYTFDLSRLWLVSGAIGGGAVTLTIFALGTELFGLLSPLPGEAELSSEVAQAPSDRP